MSKPISPQQAYNGIINNLKVFQTIELDSNDYLKVIEKISQSHITGGGIFDALIAQAALKANVNILLTLNPKHFTRLGEAIWGRGTRVPRPPDLLPQIASLVQDPEL